MGPGPTLEYNPRCIQRYLSAGCAAYTKVEITHRVVSQSKTLAAFQDKLASTTGVLATGRLTLFNSKNSVGVPSSPLLFLLS